MMQEPSVKGQYTHSPLKKAPEEFYYSKLPRETVKRVYMVSGINLLIYSHRSTFFFWYKNFQE